MERTTAIKKVKKLLGDKAYWRIGSVITSPERRDKVARERLEHAFGIAMLKRDMETRKYELLERDERYQVAKSEWTRRTREFDVMQNRDEGAYRFEVGTQSGGALNFIQPKAYGDTWEEIFTKLEAPKSLESKDDALARHNRELADINQNE